MVIYAIPTLSEGWQQHCTQSAKCSLKKNQTKTHQNEQLQVTIRNAVTRHEWGSSFIQFQIWNRGKTTKDRITDKEDDLLFSIAQNNKKYIWQVTPKILLSSYVLLLVFYMFENEMQHQYIASKWKQTSLIFSKCFLYWNIFGWSCMLVKQSIFLKNVDQLLSNTAYHIQFLFTF